MSGKPVGIALAPPLCAILASIVLAAPALAQNEQFIPALVYRTGAYSPNGVPLANGIADYYKLINARDGGINGNKPLTGEQVRWGYENLDISADRIKQLGFEGVLRPIKVSCADHEGAHTGRIQTWDGENWKITSDWYVSDDSVIAPMVKDAAAKYAAEKKIATGCL